MNRFAARWYDPTIARWHSPDPLEQMHSPYVALCNDPANFVDPDGRAGIHLSDWDKENLIGYASVIASGCALAGIGQALQGASGIGQAFQTIRGVLSAVSTISSGVSLIQNIVAMASKFGVGDEVAMAKSEAVSGEINNHGVCVYKSSTSEVDSNNRNPASGVNSDLSDTGTVSSIFYSYSQFQRQQIGGNTTANLYTDFGYVSIKNLIESLNGFIDGNPDTKNSFKISEPSSYIHIDYKFADNAKNLNYWVGIFRNHSKGGFVYANGQRVHWGLGNSQIGIEVGGEISLMEYKAFRVNLSTTIGAGQQFSTFDGKGRDGCWGSKGFGYIAVNRIGLSTPAFRGMSLSANYSVLFHHATFPSVVGPTDEHFGKTTIFNKGNFFEINISWQIGK
ncbi:MAG: hypothetical protein K1X54_11020 [Flavobacteriales bacterium]|nr:hypothetical protein [Flavobacteriales bacterium]